MFARGDDFYFRHKNGLHKRGCDGKFQSIVGGIDGGVDGVERLSNGNLIVSSWRGVIHYVQPDGKRRTLLDGRNYEFFSADIGLDPESRTVYLPRSLKNAAVPYELK